MTDAHGLSGEAFLHFFILCLGAIQALLLALEPDESERARLSRVARSPRRTCAKLKDVRPR